MAVASIGSGGGATGAIGYVLRDEKSKNGDKKSPKIIGGNVNLGGTSAQIKLDFKDYENLKPNLKNKASHISISLKKGEKMTEEKKEEFSQKLLSNLGYEDRPYLLVEHFDKEYEHWHIIAGRIDEKGKVVSDSNLALRTIAETKKLEVEFGLEQVEFKPKNDRQIKRKEYKMMERTEQISVLVEAKIAIDEIIKTKPETKEFVEQMNKFGFEVLPNVSETTGKMNGFSFKKDEITFKASAIAKECSFQNLIKNGLDYEQERDKEFLIKLKDEVKSHESAEKSVDESGNDRGNKDTESIIERPEPIVKRTEFILGNPTTPAEINGDGIGNRKNEILNQQACRANTVHNVGTQPPSNRTKKSELADDRFYQDKTIERFTERPKDSDRESQINDEQTKRAFNTNRRNEEELKTETVENVEIGEAVFMFHERQFVNQTEQSAVKTMFELIKTQDKAISKFGLIVKPEDEIFVKKGLEKQLEMSPNKYDLETAERFNNQEKPLRTQFEVTAVLLEAKMTNGELQDYVIRTAIRKTIDLGKEESKLEFATTQPIYISSINEPANINLASSNEIFDQIMSQIEALKETQNLPINDTEFNLIKERIGCLAETPQQQTEYLKTFNETNPNAKIEFENRTELEVFAAILKQLPIEKQAEMFENLINQPEESRNNFEPDNREVFELSF